MPDLVGLPIESAEGALARVGLKVVPAFVSVAIAPVGSGNAPPRLPVKPGSVLTQIPLPGSRVYEKTPVKLTVAR
jgi:beta-lactam-binding protein with PASTA domain